jgi:EpsI family protein
MEIGDSWTGETIELAQPEREILRATDLMLRRYYPRAASARTSSTSAGASHQPPVVLYVAYYQSQRTGATYHSPRNCLPGSGWQFTEQRKTVVRGPYGGDALVNEAIVQNGLDRQIILYWYQDRGRILASEYSAKLYLMWDALTKNRSDGAMVRVSVAVGTDVAEARRLAIRFVGDTWRLLSDHLAGQALPGR